MLCRVMPYGKSDCRHGNEAIMTIKWQMDFDSTETMTSHVCQECFDNRPSFVNVIESKPIKEGVEIDTI